MTTDISGCTAVGVQGQRRSAAPGELGYAVKACRAHSRTLLFVLDDIDNRLRPGVLIQWIQQNASVSEHLGIDPALDATTGVPLLIASSSGNPKPSYNDEYQRDGAR